MPSPVPSQISRQKYISLTTFRKNGEAVATPVWFGEEADKLYVMTRSDMGKTKRIRNNSQVKSGSMHHPWQSNGAGISGGGANPTRG